MIVDVTDWNIQKFKDIDKLVGSTFSVREGFKLGGVSSPAILIKETSEDFHALLPFDITEIHCQVELRPAGLLVNFHSNLRELIWIVPYRKSAIYRSMQDLKIYCDTAYIKMPRGVRGSALGAFFSKMMWQRAKYLDSLSLPR